jgi:hypothetical protein
MSVEIALGERGADRRVADQWIYAIMTTVAHFGWGASWWP